ncbi:hypothetical protein GCM10027276_34520 [Comamonas piscis]
MDAVFSQLEQVAVNSIVVDLKYGGIYINSKVPAESVVPEIEYATLDPDSLMTTLTLNDLLSLPDISTLICCAIGPNSEGSAIVELGPLIVMPLGTHVPFFSKYGGSQTHSGTAYG